MSSSTPVRHLRDETSKPITRAHTDIPRPAAEARARAAAPDTEEVSFPLGDQSVDY